MDQLKDWQEILDMAIPVGNIQIQDKVEQQIDLINKVLRKSA